MSTSQLFEYTPGTVDRDDPLHGELMELNMGPQHPATHGVLRIKVVLDGETMREVEPVVGYLHRGKEKTCESLGWRKFFPHTDRLDYVQPLLNNCAYAMALEKLAGLEVPERGQQIRVLLMEMSRIMAHLIYLGTTSIDLGAITMFFFTFKERERAYSLLDAYTGHRMNNTYVRIGGVYADVEDNVAAGIKEWVNAFPKAIDEFETMLTGNRIWFDRNRNIGILTKEQCKAWSLTGPNLRGSGEAYDLRKAMPYSGYEQYDFEIPVGTVGDCYDRYLVRIEEMRQSNRIVKQCVDWLRANPGPVISGNHKVAPPSRVDMKSNMEELIHHFKLFTEGMHVPEGEAYAAVEHPKGEFGIYIVSDGANKPYRLKIRPPGFVHLAALDEMARGHMIADAVAIIGTMDIVFGEIDR
jgi:NADH-quinone oxidoreductase subunit D